MVSEPGFSCLYSVLTSGIDSIGFMAFEFHENIYHVFHPKHLS